MIVPWGLLAQLGGIAVACVALWGWGYSVANAGWQRKEEKRLAVAAEAERANAATQARWQDNRITASSERSSRDKIISNADARARDAESRLRDALSRAVPPSACPAADQALESTRADLAACAGEYRALGSELESRQSELKQVIEAWPR